MRHRRLALAMSMVAAFAASAPAAQVRHLNVPAALNLYSSSTYPQFFDSLSRDGAVDQNLFKTFDKTANAWVHAPGTDPQRRAIIAASVALEIAHVLRNRPPKLSAEYLVRPPLSTADIGDRLDRYRAGQYSDVRAHVAVPHVAQALRYKDFSSVAGRWLTTHASDRDRLVAASVAVEIAHQLRFEPPDRAADYLIWAGSLITKTRPVSMPAVERQWFLAAFSGMQELSEPWMLPIRVERVQPGRTSSERLSFRRYDLPAGGFVATAMQRFPEEQRFRLIGIDADASSGSFDWAYTPNELAFEQRVASMSTSASPTTREDAEIAGFRLIATRALAQRATAPELVSRYRALTEPTLGADVAVRIARLEAGQGLWEEAQATLRPLLDNSLVAPPLAHLARVILARAYRVQGRHDEAIAALREALALVPRARTASVLLAAELMLDGPGTAAQREANDLMHTFSDDPIRDPWSIVVYGDAYLWEARMTALQDLLR